MKQKTTKQRIKAVKKAFKEYQSDKISFQTAICPYCFDDHDDFDRCKEARKQAIEEFAEKLKGEFFESDDELTYCKRYIFESVEFVKKEMLK